MKPFKHLKKMSLNTCYLFNDASKLHCKIVHTEWLIFLMMTEIEKERDRQRGEGEVRGEGRHREKVGRY